MALNNNRFVIKFGGDTKELKGAVAEANDSLSGFVDKVKGFGGALIAGFAVGEIAAGLKEVIQMAGESIDNEQKLLMALRGRVDIQSRLLDQAEILAQTTLFEDDDIIKQQQVLASMGLTEQQIKKVIEAGIQLSSVFGIDLSQSTEALAKSYFGIGKSLAAISPEFKALTAAQLKNGEAVDLVLQKYQGFAQGLTEIGSGPLSQFEKQLGELKEAFGKLLLPVVNPVLERTTSILKGLTNEDISPWLRYFAALTPVGLNELGKLNERLEKTKELLSNTVPLNAPDSMASFLSRFSPDALGIAPPPTPPKPPKPKAPKYRQFEGSLGAEDPFTAMMPKMVEAGDQFAEMQRKMREEMQKTRAEGELYREQLSQQFAFIAVSLSDQMASTIAGQQSFAQALSGTVRSVVAAYEKQALAALIAKALQDKKFSSFAAIAAAVSGFAIIKGLFARIGAGGSGGGGAGISSGGFRQGEGTRSGFAPNTIDVNVRGMVAGRDLAFVLDQNSYSNYYVKRGG